MIFRRQKLMATDRRYTITLNSKTRPKKEKKETSEKYISSCFVFSIHWLLIIDALIADMQPNKIDEWTLKHWVRMTNSNLTTKTDERANKTLRLFHTPTIVVEILNLMRFRVYHCYWHGRLSLLWFSITAITANGDNGQPRIRNYGNVCIGPNMPCN